MECVEQSWNKPCHRDNSAKRISTKFKSLRKALKSWHTKISTVKALIGDCNKVILLFDSLEEARPLTVPERNFRRIVKLHLEDILKLQNIYWKQRCTIGNIKVGEENSKFFQSMATERYRRNAISSLKDENGDLVYDHHLMQGMIWSDFHNRMGTSHGIQLGFDLGDLIQPVDGLHELSDPF